MVAGESLLLLPQSNGDAARALLRAGRAGLRVDPPRPLDSTLGWLESPEGWTDQKSPDGPSTDRRLARVQFALW